MNAETLLKNISELLKKNEKFFNENPELFYAVRERLFKAFDDDEDEQDYDTDDLGLFDDPYANKKRKKETNEDYDDEDESDPYSLDEDDYEDEYDNDEDKNGDDEYSYSNQDDDEEDDAASRFLREKENQKKEPKTLTSDFKPYTKEDETLPEQTKDVPKQEELTTKEEQQDWQPRKDLSPEKKRLVNKHKDDGYSEWESHYLANAHQMPSLASQWYSKPTEPSRKMLETIRAVAKDRLKELVNKKNQLADPTVNPIKSLHAKINTLHDTLTRDYNDAKQAHMNTPQFNKMNPIQKIESLANFHKKWHEDNPDHRKTLDIITNARIEGGKDYRSQRKKALEDYEKRIANLQPEDDAYGEEPDSENKQSYEAKPLPEDFDEDAYMESIPSYGGSWQVGGDSPLTSEQASQMIGAEQEDSNGDLSNQLNVKSDPVSVISSKYPSYAEHLKNKHANKAQTASTAVKQVEPKQNLSTGLTNEQKISQKASPEMVTRLNAVKNLKGNK